MDTSDFVQYVKDVCKDNDIKIDLRQSKYIDVNGTSCSGYFDELNRTLVVAIKRPQEEWLPILAHEFSHLKQYLDDTRDWNGCYCTCLQKDLDCVGVLDLWLANDVELTDEQLEKYINHTIAVELECEKNTVELIKKFELPIDVELYIKDANSYLMFYQAVREFRKWSIEGRTCRKNKKVMARMKSEFTYSYYSKLPEDLLNDYRWCFFEDAENV